MPTFPEGKAALLRAGFRFHEPGRCRGTHCQADIEWYWTPKGKRMPFNPDGTPHHTTCHDAAQFRTKKPRRQ